MTIIPPRDDHGYGAFSVDCLAAFTLSKDSIIPDHLDKQLLNNNLQIVLHLIRRELTPPNPTIKCIGCNKEVPTHEDVSFASAVADGWTDGWIAVEEEEV